MRTPSGVTILLALKGRAAFTRRWMEYARRTAFPFNVFIADGSLDDNNEEVFASPDEFAGLRYLYVRYPPDRQYRDFYAKIADALDRIDTPFVALGENDDFFVASGVRDAVTFLSSHVEFETCGGQWAHFWVTPAADQLAPLYGNVQWKSSCDARAIDGATASERLHTVSGWFGTPTYYHVRRTQGLREIFKAVCAADLQDIFLNEQMIGFLTAIGGRSMQLPSLYIARQGNPSESAADAHRAMHGDALSRMLLPSWSEDFFRFLGAAEDALSRHDGISIEEARQSVVEAYRRATAPAMFGELLRQPTVSTGGTLALAFVRRLLALPPQSRRRRIARAFYRRAHWVSADVMHGTQVRSRRIRRAPQDIGPIHRFLTRAPVA